MDIDIESLKELLITYGTLYGLKIISAIAIFVIGKWVAKRLVNFAKKLMLRANIDPTLVVFGGNILYGITIAFIVIAALSQLGIDTTSLAAAIAAAGLAIGLALQGSLSNFAAGIIIILFRPFKLGDFVDAAGVSGTITDISIFTTTFLTPDNKTIIVPNSRITTDPITNFSANATRRMDLVIGVGYEDDLKQVKSILQDIVDSEDRILDDPAPVIAVSELNESSVDLVVRPWTKIGDFWPTRFDLLEEIKTRFDAEGITIPFPQRDVHMFHIDGSEKKASAKKTKSPAKKTATKKKAS